MPEQTEKTLWVNKLTKTEESNHRIDENNHSFAFLPNIDGNTSEPFVRNESTVCSRHRSETG